MRGWARVLVAAAAALSISGCAGQFATDRAAVEYNRALSSARNEVLLLNVLRAWAYEPLQFSTVSQVSGAVRTNAEISLPLTGILGGGDPTEFGPSVTLGNRNPNVTILPLDTREFVQGINRPVGAQVVGHLINQGWSRPTVLTLAVGGVRCGTEQHPDVRMNYGPESEHADRFVRVFSESADFNVQSRAIARLNLPAQEALTLARENAAAGLRVRIADSAGQSHDSGQSVGLSSWDPQEGRTPGTASRLDVEVVDENSAVLTGLDFSRFCNSHAQPGDAGRWQLIMRSVQGMIRYLAEVHRANVAHDITGCGADPAVPPPSHPGIVQFRIYATCQGARPPRDAAISTFYRGQYFYVPRATAENRGDETLRILSMLSELLALQVTEQSIASSRPLIAVSQ